MIKPETIIKSLHGRGDLEQRTWAAYVDLCDLLLKHGESLYVAVNIFVAIQHEKKNADGN